MPIFPVRFLFHRLTGWNILHLHWLSPFVLPGENKYLKYISSLYLLSFLVLIKILNFKLVWTLHENLPQEDEFHDDKTIRRIVSKFSDITIFHSPAALVEANELGFDTKNAHIIPHGNYNDSYPNNVSQEKARKKLELNKNDFVFLFFGMVKPYKGIDTLLETFEKLLDENKKIKLILAGESTNKKLNELILKYEKKYSNNISLFLHHIDVEDVQYFFNAADIVILPFKKNTTSGSAVLAMSFGKPLIAPLLGNIIDLPQNVGIFYQPNDNNGLLTSMRKAINEREELPNTGKLGLKYAKSLSWKEIAKKTNAVLSDILAS
jgi:beta-1,4-mannosyltransferase